jgi:hypothetical protein
MNIYLMNFFHLFLKLIKKIEGIFNGKLILENK